MRKKHFWGLLPAIAAMLVLLPVTAQAATASTDYVDENGDLQTVEATVIEASDRATLADGWYVANSDVTVVDINISGNVRLILADGCTLTANGNYYKGGVNLFSGNTLIIYGQSAGTGKLAAAGGAYGSGIGGDYWSAISRNGGTIIINGGTVTADAGSYAAGIGGGSGGNGGAVTIKGGTITANGDAGIGGAGGSGGTVEITGGSVKAGSIQSTPTNGTANGNQALGLVTVTLPGASAGTKVTGLTIPDAPYYGTNDLFTDGDGKLYLWLPTGAAVSQARTADTIYSSVSGSLVADADKPGIASVTPSGTDTALDGNLVITFNEEMRTNVGTVSLNSTVLTGGAWDSGNTVFTVPYSSLVSGTVYTVNVSGFMDYSGNEMDADGTHSFTAKAGGGSGDGSDSGADAALATLTHSDDDGAEEDSYVSRTLTDSVTGITVSGVIHRDAVLTVANTVLHDMGTCAACDAIRACMMDSGLITLIDKDISLSLSFIGTITVTIPVGSAYNGETITILHCADGTPKTYSGIVRDGKVTFNVTSLSPFSVFVDAGELDDVPKTGDDGFPLWLGLLASGMLLSSLLLLVRRRPESV